MPTTFLFMVFPLLCSAHTALPLSLPGYQWQRVAE
jgi:hypothetical protein